MRNNAETIEFHIVSHRHCSSSCDAIDFRCKFHRIVALYPPVQLLIDCIGVVMGNALWT